MTWPSGRVDQFGPLAADAGYRLREGAAAAEPLRGFTPKNTAAATTAIRTGPGREADRSGARQPADAEHQTRPARTPERTNQRRAENDPLSPIPYFILSSGAS